jgi:Tat protein translocase TatB subunit
MFGIGFWELLVIMAVALLAFGPERLPEMARKLGRISAELKKHSDGLRREFYNTVYAPADELKRGTEEAKRGLQSVKQEVRRLVSPPPDEPSPRSECSVEPEQKKPVQPSSESATTEDPS